MKRLISGMTVAMALVASGELECGRPALSAQQERGADLYGRMCALCHGARGEGYKADQATALGHPLFLASASDEYMRRAISDGRNGTTMSAWGKAHGGPLTAEDVNALVGFIRSWGQDRPRAVLDERAPVGYGINAVGTWSRECAACHGARGTGGPNVGIGNPQLLDVASNGFLRYAIKEGRPGTAMPAFGHRLGDKVVDDLVLLLRSWQQPPPVARITPQTPPAPIPLGPVPLNPKGPEPIGFRATPATTPADVVKAQLDRGARFALLDARAPSDYTNEHIAGAVSVPFYEPDPYVKDLPHDAWLVCYCACPHMESKTLAAKLVEKGFKKVTVLDEGLGVWRGRQYPTHTGRDP